MSRPIPAVSKRLVAVAGVVLDEISQAPRSKYYLAAEADCSAPTIQRALDWLREIGAPLEFDRERHVWRLTSPWVPTFILGRGGLEVVP